MKKLKTISNQIQNNTFSYTGRGAFESIVKKHKDKIIVWLEDLMPLQIQIENLNQLENVDFQKRNYTRILTKLLNEQYQEFVSLNILVRDSNIIAQYYNEEYNLTILYENLISNKYLKYPGKYEKYVDFNIFQQFIIMYREELLLSLENGDEIDQYQKPVQTNPQKNSPKVEDIASNDNTLNNEEKEEPEQPQEVKKETNWTNLLLGKLK